MNSSLLKFAPIFKPDEYGAEEKRILGPFFTNLHKPVYSPILLPPELIGALCSRSSRAEGDLRNIYLKEYIEPFLNPIREEKDTDLSWNEKIEYRKALLEFIELLNKHSSRDIFSNPKARSFYVKWLAQYGDDSIAQMAGTHLIFRGISQIAIKHLEDQRIGLAPIEKSTRYINYGEKINGKYLYYTDPTLEDFGLKSEYEKVMDGLFDTYNNLMPKMTEWLKKKFPDEKSGVIEKKAFDLLRGLLPTSTLSQVAFFGNGQAFEHMINRSSKHRLGEIRWISACALEELYEVTPSFLRRIKDEDKKEMIESYQEYLIGKRDRVKPFVEEFNFNSISNESNSSKVSLIEYDKDGEEKVITGMLYSGIGNNSSWNDIFSKVKAMSEFDKRKIIDAYLDGRVARWQKVGRAFENAYLRFEIIMNIGAWRDLHRHRMLTQERQYISCDHGYDTPEEVEEAGLKKEFCDAIDPVRELNVKISVMDKNLAEYAATLAHRIRFMQFKNLRECFWEMELRTIPEGHSDYRKIEQQKFQLLKQAYPLIAEKMMVNLNDYDFARRGQDKKIEEKLKKLEI